MDVLGKCIYKCTAQMCVTQTSLHSLYPVVPGVRICVDVPAIPLQECFRIFSASARLVFEIADWICSIFDAAVNPHIRIRCILSSWFFEHLYMGFIDMQVILLQKLLLETADYILEPVTVYNQQPVGQRCSAQLQSESFPFLFLTV